MNEKPLGIGLVPNAVTTLDLGALPLIPLIKASNEGVYLDLLKAPIFLELNIFPKPPEGNTTGKKGGAIGGKKVVMLVGTVITGVTVGVTLVNELIEVIAVLVVGVTIGVTNWRVFVTSTVLVCVNIEDFAVIEVMLDVTDGTTVNNNPPDCIADIFGVAILAVVNPKATAVPEANLENP